MRFVHADCEKIAIENPVGIMSGLYRKPDQIIQPYEFGDPFEKRTCLWLKNLSPLVPTKVVQPPERQKLPGGHTIPAWYSKGREGPAEEQVKDISRHCGGHGGAVGSGG